MCLAPQSEKPLALNVKPTAIGDWNICANPDEVWEALMLRWLREDSNVGLILLEELGLELAMRFGRSIEIGDRLEVKVTHCDPRSDAVHFQEVSNSALKGLSL